MAQLVLENFKYGLEYRRSELTANPGTLFDALNCFVNSGGEIERRRAWFPMSAYNATQAFMKPADGIHVSGDGKTGTYAGVEFENNGVVFIGDFSSAGTAPGVLTATTAASNSLVRQYMSTLFQYSLANVVTLTDPGGAVLHILSAFGYNVTLSTPVNTSGSGVITYTNNGTTDVTITFSGTWAAGDHIAIRVQQTNYDVTVGYGVGPVSTYPNFSSSSIFGGGTTPASSYMQLTDPYSTSPFLGTNNITDLVSCTFAGKVFCLATWSSGRTYGYYKGTVINDFLGMGIYNALINVGDNTQTNINIAAAIAALITYSFNSQSLGGDFTCTSSGNVVTFHTSATSITVTSTHNSIAGIATIGTNGTNNVTLTITGTWAEGEYWSVLTAGITAVGTATASGGVLSGVTPTFCYTFGTKVYLLAKTSVYYSIVNLYDAATGVVDFHTGASGAGNIDLSKQDGINDTLVTCCAYQGNLAFFFKNSIQIWQMDANDALDQRVQALGNTGAIGRYAVCPIGNLDVLYVDYGGLRSLRPRVASENALPFDVGAPINPTLRAQLKAKTLFANQVVMGYDPVNQIVFLTVPYNTSSSVSFVSQCTIACWALSYWPDSKVVAWSQFDTKYASCVGAVATQQVIFPIKFITWHGALYMFANFTHVLSSGTTVVTDVCLAVYDPTNVLRTLYAAGYDNSVATWTTPFLNAKSPGVRKQSNGLDIIASGGWTVAGCMAPSDGTLTDIVTVGSAGTSAVTNSSTPEGPAYGWTTWGNHVQFKGTGTVSNVANDLGLLSTTAGQQVFSQLIWYYEPGDRE